MPYYHCLHNRQPGHDKVYVVLINRLIDLIRQRQMFQVMAYWGKSTARKLTSQCKGEYSKLDEAQEVMDNLVQRHLWDGHEDVADARYDGGLSVAQILAKADTSRMLLVQRTPHDPAPMPKKPPTRPPATRPVRSVRM